MTATPSVRPLDAGWTLEPRPGSAVPTEVAAAGPVAATVPGVVHTDLLAAGLIGDPYHGSNERVQEWIGRTGWRYRTEFAAPSDAERTELVFEGIDTVATVALNGAVILKSRNQHRSYRVDVTPLLRAKGNELVVDFDAPVPYADRASLELGYRPHVNHHPYNAIRKMACSFGWDWGIDTATSGIWRPVRLESWSTARLAEVRASARLVGSAGRADLHVEVARTADVPLAVRASIAGHRAVALLAPGESAATLSLELAEVEAWWPAGYGEQPLYGLDIVLETGDGETLDRATRRVGFRDVRIDTEPDVAGAPLTLVVNGTPIFAKGVNWIPDDAFPHRVDRARYARRLDQAVAANVNLIRVWGGGIYESDDFYDLADERGLLVWQDFLLACAAYAEEEPLRSEIEAEAREAIVRLAAHPSLAVLNGNNENLQGFEEWNWQLRLEGRTWGAGYYYELFPALVAELAPHVPYTPGSPFSPIVGEPSNGEHSGSMHIWDLWNRKDYSHYRDYRPRFVAEFGWQGPPAWTTLVDALDDFPLTPESPGMLVHQKAMEGNTKLTDGLLPHFPLPNTMPEWHWAMQLNQAIAIRTAIEYFRSLAPHCRGAVVWQLNDCWPVVSWAAVDGDGREKPLWHAIRRAFAPRLLTFQPEGGGLELAVVNDSAEAWRGAVVLYRADFDGRRLAETTLTVEAAPRATVRLPVPAALAVPGDAAAELLRAELDGERTEWFFAEYRDSRLGPADLEVAVAPADDGAEVRVTARGLVRDLALLVDIADPGARVDDALATLLPGESATFRVTGTASAALAAAPVLRTANELVGGR